jgi:ABC-type transport system substrate-binding protein
MKRILAAALCAAAAASFAQAPAPQKVFRYAWLIAETSFDPEKVQDVYSGIANSAMFDTPLTYDYLARPPKLIPNTLTSLPEISADGMTYTMHVKPGIYFADDPAFNGKKRELTAADFVYSIKRLFDPRLSAPLLSEVEGYIRGSEEVVAKARKENKLDYDAPMEGLKALDRYTFQIKLTKPIYVWVYNLADNRICGAVAREVVEKYGDDVGSHPVGTGPYRLTFWKRSAKMVFERNPNFREQYFDGQPTRGDTEAEQILAKLKGRRLPMVDRVEVSVIEESQPRWLSFQNEEMDLIFGVPTEFTNLAMPNNKLARNLERRGIRMAQVPALDLTYAYFNMKDPTVGGYTPEKVALRRAISLSYKTRDEIAVLRKNQAIPAQAPYSPGVAGYDPNFRTTANEYNVAKAKALLDMFGYLDRDGDGWREMPDGSPLVIKYNSTPTAIDTEYDKLWRRSLDDIGVRLEIHKAKWPDLMKESQNGKLMMWQLGGSASMPDADTWLTSLYGPNCGFKGNQACFELPEYDRLYEKAHVMRDSPERTKLYEEMAKLVVAYAPWKINVNRINTDMWYPWVIGYRRPLIITDNFWKYIDIDTDLEKEKGAFRPLKVGG